MGIVLVHFYFYFLLLKKEDAWFPFRVSLEGFGI